MEQNDFRRSRIKLPPDTFAFGPDEPDAPPSDLIDKNTWNSIISLPDDVSIRTSDHFGSVLSSFWSLWDEWSCMVGALQEVVKDPKDSPIAHVACISGDELQASIYNVLVGFYRLAFSSLRNVLEQMTIGMHLELANDLVLFNDWLKGDQELRFGWAADNAHRHITIENLESHFMNNLHDSLFRQKQQTFGPGFARKLFGVLSGYTHGGPEYTNADIWEGSTGPIFVPQAFEKWAIVFSKTCALSVLEAKLAQPKISKLAYGSSLSIHDLFKQIVDTIPEKEEGLIIFQEAQNLKNLW